MKGTRTTAVTLVTELDLPMVDIFDPIENERFLPMVEQLQLEGQWLMKTPLWFSVIEHDAVKELQKDPRLHTMGKRIFELQGVSEGRAYDRFSRAILHREGAEHTRLRKLVARAFTPRATYRVRPLMRTFLEERVIAMGERGGGDFMAEIAEAYPIAVICALVGAPPEDWPKFSAWADDVFRAFNFNLGEDLDRITEAGDAMQGYIEDLIAQRRAEPRDDLISELLAVEQEGDRLSYREMCDLVQALILAGTDTTRNQLGLGIMRLAQFPEQWRAIVANPALIPGAVEEILRFDPTIAGTPRFVTEDVEFRGVVFPAGTLVTLMTVAANRDPKVVKCPMHFDTAADRGSWQPLTFGSGPHYCLGASLARAELQEALAVLAHHWDSFELAGEPEMKPVIGLFGPRTLPLLVNPS